MAKLPAVLTPRCPWALLRPGRVTRFRRICARLATRGKMRNDPSARRLRRGTTAVTIGAVEWRKAKAMSGRR